MLLRGGDQAAGPRPAARPVRPLRMAARAGVVGMLLVGGVGLTLRGEAPSPPRVIARTSSASSGALAAAATSATAGLDGQHAVADALGLALATGDASGLSDIIDPAAPAVLARWQAVVQSVHSLGLTDVSYTVGTPTRTPAPASGAWAQAGQVGLTLTYRLGGWDPAPAQAQVSLTEGLRGSRWLLIADPVPSPTPSAAPSSEPTDPWLLGPVSVARTAHVMVIGDPGQPKDVQGLAARLEAAVSAVRRVVSSDHWNGKVVAYASRAPGFVSAWFGATAATGVTPAGREPATFAAEVRSLGEVSRLAVTPFLITRNDDRSRAVLRHEVTHVALAGSGVAAMPTWLAEGTAEFVAYGGSATAKVDAVTALSQRGLPQPTWRALRTGSWQPILGVRPEEFYAGSTATVGDHYTAAWLTCLYVASHYGQPALFALYAAAAAGHATDPAAAEAAALRQVLHTDRRTLTKNVAGFAHDLRNNFV